MFKKIVGGLGFAPETFYNLLLKECILIINGDRERQEQELLNMSYSVINGIGCTFGDKKFKLINPYEKQKEEPKNKRTTREELLKDMEDIKKKFNKHWGRGKVPPIFFYYASDSSEYMKGVRTWALKR